MSKTKVKPTIKISGVRVKSYDFTGEVEPSDLTKEMLDALRIVNVDDCETVLEVSGEFSVNAYRDEATEIDEVYSVVITNGEHSIDIVNDELLDLNALGESILDASEGYDFYQDYLDSEGDRQYDSWRDSQLD